MSLVFAESLRSWRTEKGYSQRQLAEKIVVNRSTIAKWEAGSRLPDMDMIYRLANALNVDVNSLMNAAWESEESPNIIMVDDERLILSGGIPVLEEVFSDAIITGFTRPSEAVAFARSNQVRFAFLDIEMGRFSGLDLCRELLQINYRTTVIFLTGYRDYSFDAWDTGARGFMLKPLTVEAVRAQLSRMRVSLPAKAEKGYGRDE
ncbi:MAG: helix-turn-helix domain-containing protein [Oscillospiraceae bacterium]|nr:helix-turn-helix domain-containing protein [Oscillospiraceae bacterium]